MVFYRKYRPQTIDELDSTTVREKLSAVLSSKSIPHAFLFTGPKGLGKTSTARIVAKVVNCTNRKDGEYNPCNTCDACVSITGGTNIDVLEIDGASNRGIDEIRDLREKIRLAPSTLKKKIYIIDEVHMLTTEAFNALLKTIEEPPSHVMFMFCTTEPQKVPATIMSRCFHINFDRAAENEIVHSLERIIKNEKLNIDKDALPEIAKHADGGFRDAAKILEELSLISQGKKITKESFQKSYKITSIPIHVASLLGALKSKKMESGLTVVNEVVSEGIDIKFFIAQALADLHLKLLIKIGIEKNQNDFPVNLRFELSEIQTLVELLTKAYQETKSAVIPQLPLEIAVIKWCTSQDSTEIERVQVSTIPSNPSNSSNNQPSIHTLRKQQQTLKVQSILNPVKTEPKKMQENIHEQRSLPSKHDNNVSILENLIYKTKPYNHSVAAVLRGSKIKLFDSKALVLETAYKFHKERLDEKKTRQLLEKVIKEITGKELEIRVELRK